LAQVGFAVCAPKHPSTSQHADGQKHVVGDD